MENSIEAARSAQEEFHSADFDYRTGSPHLKHQALHERLVARLTASVAAVRNSGLPLSVLEVGSGDGTFTARLLDLGCRVVGTEMSPSSLEVLRQRFSSNENFTGVLDSEGTLSILDDQQFSLAVCISVLHHIPEYRSFINGPVVDHILPGGSLVILQDPLYYPSLGHLQLALSKFAYFSWRATQGNYVQGLATRWRRLRGIYDETKVEDMAEYHIVRQGIDQDAVIKELVKQFADVDFYAYWSSHASIWQRLGEVVGVHNTFGITAHGLAGDEVA